MPPIEAHTRLAQRLIVALRPDVQIDAPGDAPTVLDQQGGSAQNVDARFPLTAFNGKTAAGVWNLWVVDGYGGDTGTLDVWMLEIDVK